MKTKLFLMLAVGVAGSAVSWGDPAVGTAAPIAVDLSTSGQARPVGPVQVNYGPDWALAEATDGVQVEVLAVTHLGQENVTTQTLVAATASTGAVPLAAAADGTRNFRLVLRTKSGSTVLGELVRDIAFGERSPASDGVLADATDDRLLHAMDFGLASAPLAYDAAWFGSSPLTLTYECEEMVRKFVFSGVTNRTTLASLTESGTYAWPFQRGNARHRLTLSDGTTTLDADYVFYSGFGTLLIVR